MRNTGDLCLVVFTFAFSASTFVPLVARAQSIVDPTTVEFVPSTDHDATLSDGTPIVNRYDLQFFMIDAPQPFQVMDLGKPTPGAGGMISVDFTTRLQAIPTPGIIYQAKVAAVGVGGAGTSEFSNTFSFSAPGSSGGSREVVPPAGAVTPTAGADTPSGPPGEKRPVKAETAGGKQAAEGAPTRPAGVRVVVAGD